MSGKNHKKVDDQHPNQRVNFMNMCMLSDGQGNVVALEKVSGNYQGTNFPGGHVERNETFTDSVIREVRVFWISEKDFRERNLAPGMEAVLRLIHDNKLSECYLWNEEGQL